jgi:uncharacterized membrane protein
METLILFIATGVVGAIAYVWWLKNDKKEKMSERKIHNH